MNAATTMTSMIASAPMAPAVPANVQVTLALALILFAIGLVGFLTRRNMILMFLSTELMFQAAALAFVAFGRMWMDLSGQLMVIFILTVAAAEAAVGLAILVTFFRNRGDIAVDDASVMKG